MTMQKACIVATHGTSQFAEKLSTSLNIPWTKIESSKFPNEELKVRIPEAGETTILLGSLSRPVNTRIIEYLLAADAIKRMGCRHIVGLLSWFAYSKQDKVFLPGEPLSAKVIATVLQDVSIRELFTLDLHNPSIAGYFEIPVTNILAAPLFIDHAKKLDLSNKIVVSPDAGSIKNSSKIADALDLPIAFASKKRDLHTGEVSMVDINQSIDGKEVFIFDDMIASGATLIEAANFLKARGAKKISVYCTHHLYIDGVQEKLDASQIDSVIVTNSIERPSSLSSKKLEVLNIAPLFMDHIEQFS